MDQPKRSRRAGGRAARRAIRSEAPFGASEVSHNDSFEQWQEEGALDTAQRAHGLWREKLESYVAPALDEGIDQTLLDFMARRREQLPDEFE